MTTKQWDIDRDSYFSNRRAAPMPKVEPKKDATEAGKQTAEKDCHKPSHDYLDGKWEPIGESTKATVKKKETERSDRTKAFMALVNCLGVVLFHGMIQLALYYVFITGAIDPDGLMVGSIANCTVAGFRVAWRFKP